MANKRFWFGILLMGLVCGTAFTQTTYNVEIMNNVPYPFLIQRVVLKDGQGVKQSKGEVGALDEGRAWGGGKIGKVHTTAPFTGTIEVIYNANVFSEDKSINKDITITAPITIPDKSGSPIKYLLNGTDSTNVRLELTQAFPADPAPKAAAKTTTTTTATTSSGAATWFKIINRTGFTIEFVHIVPAGSSGWGNNLLKPNNFIQNETPGGTVIDLPKPLNNDNRYNIRVRDSRSKAGTYTKMNVLIKNGMEVIFTQKDLDE